MVSGVAATLILPHEWVHIPYKEGCRNTYSTASVPRLPDSVIFVGEIVFTARTMADLNPGWCIARVEHRYVGFPWWAPGYALIRSYPLAEDERKCFFDVRRSRGLLTHYLPVFVPYYCCHIQPLDRAAADLRVLNDGPPKSGIRVIGSVYEGTYTTGAPAVGVRVQIAGPAGVLSIATDRLGIYERQGLPAGHYSVRIDGDEYTAEGDVRTGESWGPALLVNRSVAPAMR